LETGAASRFCCVGCEAVYRLLTEQHLDRYYDLRGDRGLPVVRVDARRRDRKWLEAIDARVEATDGISRVEVDVQGLHCSACVWLFEELFRREAGGVSLLVNPTVGRMTLAVEKPFSVLRFLEQVEAFGYLVGPRSREDRSAARPLLFRLGLCAALTMNAMIFAFALYAGLATGPIFRLFQDLELALGTAAVLIGGSVFFRSALAGLKRRVLHLDLPIALGIAAAYAGSIHGWATGRDPYFDTLCVFITLMLVGRYLQQRALEKNRHMLLEGDDVSGLLARRLDADGTPRVVPCTSLSAGDRIMVAPFDLVPVDGVVEVDTSCSLDWINGESRPRTYAKGATVPAGAFNAGSCAFVLRAGQGFADSSLTDILRTPPRVLGGRQADTPFWKRYAPVYVTTVLTLAAGAFLLWWGLSHDVHRALSVTTALLVITCPCAFGIATPLAYEIVRSGLRRRGLFVRSAGFLDRATMVKRVVFDKTGTLTEGTMVLGSLAPLAALTAEDATILAALAGATAHPKGMAVAGALAANKVQPASIASEEVTGRGVEAFLDGRRYRFGEPQWATGTAHDGDIAFGCDGRALAVLSTEERLRPDARREVERLRKEGFDVWMLSGDGKERVRAIAEAVGIESEKALGGLGPEEKAAWLAENDHGDVLMIGDGINDLPAVAKAFCSGTPAVDRPFVAARSDFYFTTPGLEPIRAALRASRFLAHVVRRNLVVALAYNVVAVSFVYAGLMTPLLCAVLMPVSSLSTIFATVLSLAPRSRAWRS